MPVTVLPFMLALVMFAVKNAAMAPPLEPARALLPVNVLLVTVMMPSL